MNIEESTVHRKFLLNLLEVIESFVDIRIGEHFQLYFKVIFSSLLYRPDLFYITSNTAFDFVIYCLIFCLADFFFKRECGLGLDVVINDVCKKVRVF